MGLNPKAPAWTPGPSSSGDRWGDSLGIIGRAVHGVGTHKSVGRAKTLGVGGRGLNLLMKKEAPGQLIQPEGPTSDRKYEGIYRTYCITVLSTIPR